MIPCRRRRRDPCSAPLGCLFPAFLLARRGQFDRRHDDHVQLHRRRVDGLADDQRVDRARLRRRRKPLCSARVPGCRPSPRSRDGRHPHPAFPGEPDPAAGPAGSRSRRRGFWSMGRSPATGIRVVGAKPRTPRPMRASMPAARSCSVFCASGAFAGLAGVNEVLGVHHRLILEFPNGAGFVGIAVGLIGGAQCLRIIPAALLFAALARRAASDRFDDRAIRG